MTREVVIGVDAGGTATRCVVVGLDGELLGRGTGGGANQFSSPDPAAALEGAVRAAVRDARGRTGGLAVSSAVFGMAGASAAGHARAVETARGAWRAAGLDGEPRVSDDIAVAFASGSAAAEGAVLIAGTGAVAASVRDGEVVRRCDGYGWLLGDAGSAVWIGLEGLRAALAAVDGRGGPTALTERLAAALGIAPGDPQEVIRVVYARRPAELGALAPEVTAAAAAGDAEAAGVCARAAERLLESLAAAVPDPAPGLPVVFAGGVLAAGPVADRVRAEVRARFGAEPLSAADGALGAAGLALRGAGAPASAHVRLIAAPA
ncbi:N-acetylglucosamine kinase [Nocardiopsis potens]|uniref:N-acetylglucosamine kinase n=1 Tax=Nocardiopsis potens TaxID=1246458 RepID=UPI0005937451|nr:BadF/BadG/BcrA/BcrD ATPase family protein [Nocardiopsis potens]